MPKKSRLVYSVGPGGASSQRDNDKSTAEPTTSQPPEQQQPRVRWERAGRKGRRGRGVLCRILEGGTIRVGDRIRVERPGG